MTMRKISAAAAIAALWGLGGPVAAQPADTAGAGVLMSCEVVQAGGGEGGEIVYNMSCKPAVGGDVAKVQSLGGDNFRVTYGNGKPAYGGGPVYILRYSGAHDEVRYGKPLDGNIGTVGR